MEKLSIMILTKNNDHIIEKTLKAIQGLADEIVVLDSESTDNTPAICKKYADKVVSFNDKGGTVTGADLRKVGINHCKNDWIFILDSDEVVSKELYDDIKKTFAKGPTVNGYYVDRMDHVFLHTYITTTKILRIFKWSKSEYKHIIHEQVHIQGPAGHFKGYLDHHSFRDVEDYFARSNRYTSIEANKLMQEHPNMSYAMIIFNAFWRPWYEFFAWWIGKGLWIRGWVPFFCSVSSGFYQFVKYMKFYEKKKIAEKKKKR